ncbi:MAG: DUF4339 domain-containing protein [Planctomycetes bacterium]|nr:DUF4339 domain-containing protein [Planctomycetota bacterium]
MGTYYIRHDGQTAYGPYGAEVVRGWLGDGRLPPETECSSDGLAWCAASDVEELRPGETAAPPALPEASLWIRQGTNVQGPYAMSRIRRYVAQRRVQPYMLFSQDGVYWLAPEHVPGLLPPGYQPVAPTGRPSAVPDAPAVARVPSSSSSAAPAPMVPAPIATSVTPKGKDFGSTTLVGYRLDDEATTRPAAAAAPPTSMVPPAPSRAGAGLSYYVRQDGRTAYGPYAAADVRAWIAEGRLVAETEFSYDGQHWLTGAQMPGLSFPAPARDEEPEAVEEDRRPPAPRSSWRTRRR